MSKLNWARRQLALATLPRTPLPELSVTQQEICLPDAQVPLLSEPVEPGRATALTATAVAKRMAKMDCMVARSE